MNYLCKKYNAKSEHVFLGWSWIFRIGAMNCGAVAPNGEENYLVCHRSPFWVFDYPDFRVYQLLIIFRAISDDIFKLSLN